MGHLSVRPLANAGEQRQASSLRREALWFERVDGPSSGAMTGRAAETAIHSVSWLLMWRVCC